MPRKAFVADLKAVIANRPYNAHGIVDLKAGNDDGSFVFKYRGAEDASQAIRLEASVTDVGDYPSSHGYLVYTTSESVPEAITKALEEFGVFAGLNISSMLRKFSQVMNTATAGSRSNLVPINEDDMDIDRSPLVEFSEEEEEKGEHENEQRDENEDKDEDEDEYEEYDEEEVYDFSSHSYERADSTHRSNIRTTESSTNSQFNARVRADLRTAKAAGFRVGHLGSLLDHGQDCFVTVSIRIAKLGISDEALQAWHLDPEQYLTLIIHYVSGYRSLDQLVAEDLSYNRLNVEIRVGISRRYKISLREALDVFSQIKGKQQRETGVLTSEGINLSPVPETEDGLHDFFISRPLNELLNVRLLALSRYRVAMGMPWNGAEAFYNDQQGRNVDGSDSMDWRYYKPEDVSSTDNLPDLVTSDHLTGLPLPKVSDLSFPLIAIQFTLRHLVRCTEFCLVCHCKIDADFEALKPYVCDKPLCLYQYLNLGFGPSVEHEILSQPDVVDLLVSFCYASASTGRLKSFPHGLGLMVPAPSLMPERAIGPSSSRHHGLMSSSQPVQNGKDIPPPTTYKARFDKATSELIFQHGDKPLKVGDWIIMSVPGVMEKHHRTVIEVLYPTVKVGCPLPLLSISDEESRLSLNMPDPQDLTPAATPPSSINVDPLIHPEAEIIIYEVHFDEISESSQRDSICMLLDTLPTVRSMQSFLRAKHTSLRQWTDRISPAALGVLRWIIASNRSCIIQSDNHGEGWRRAEERVKGMKGYLQFRFAQGAPDKEQRFIKAVRETTARLGLKYPTMFAWHGSPLQNWHGIVREGLHFKEVLNGRVFGNGVYHSLELLTSLGYSNPYYVPYGDTGMSRIGWPHSHLRLSQALSLNEIINAPEEFVSKTPHLVVHQLDWIQTRYLFVKCNNSDIGGSEERVPTEAFEQDPSYNPIGFSQERIVIPITAVSKSRRPATKSLKSGNKRSKVESIVELVDEVYLSDATDIEDVQILCSQSEAEAEEQQVDSDSLIGKGKASELPDEPILFDSSKTDFVPGELDHSSLPLLAPPSYATSQATKALQRELKSLLKVQDAQPAHELGWYLDPELITNVYQWIVELHSFEAQLPLAEDLKQKGLKSIILELRFGKEFPYSPPFVRVIRPRFLPFLHGGGGHVTAGGALCMELLTNTGWNPASSIESVLLQVRLAISSTDPRPARLERGPVRDYSTGEALEAFRRACLTHGWQVPADLEHITAG